jgi:hypothetical protein
MVELEGEVREENGLIVVPINTPPDHEHVYHAFRTPEFVEENEFEGPFGEESVEVGKWVEWVLEVISAQEGVSTVLAHPACMWLADELDGFDNLCRSISKNHTSIPIGQHGNSR